VSKNQAAGGTGADALGGGIFNELGSTLTVNDTTFTDNQALGGDGGGGPGGWGIGGGSGGQRPANREHATLTSHPRRGGATAGGGIVGLASGGAIDNQNGGSLRINTTMFTGNEARGGHRGSASDYFDGLAAGGAINNGSIFTGAATLTMTDSSLVGNV